VQQRLDQHQLALTHQPLHLAAAEQLVRIRAEIGKRPPVASLELLWTPHQGEHLLVSGFVHPPTEQRAWETLQISGEADVLLVKGLEGSTDLPTSRPTIASRLRQGEPERLLLHPRDHGLAGADVPLTDLESWRQQALAALQGEGPLAHAAALESGLLPLGRRPVRAAGGRPRSGRSPAALAGRAAPAGAAAMTDRPINRHCHCFAFEADFSRDLRCIPMAVRRKLDLAGVKLKLVHWHGLSAAEREQLLAWADNPGAIAELRTWLLARSQQLPDGPAKPLEPVQASPWQQGEQVPEVLQQACRQLGLELRQNAWAELEELQRFALVKLSHPGHEHRNLPRALAEFGALQP